MGAITGSVSVLTAISAALKLAAGGPAGWVVAGILILVILVIWKNGKDILNNITYQDSQNQKDNGLASNTTDNQDLSGQVDNSITQTDQTRTDGKQDRPVDPTPPPAPGNNLS